jgi:hypothetical protein
VHPHTAAATQNGTTAAQTNALATMLQLPIDDAFSVG